MRCTHTGVDEGAEGGWVLWAGCVGGGLYTIPSILL